MAGRRRQSDPTRASRDGHEFHENWAARKAIQLLSPDADLAGIAVEGPHPAEGARSPKSVVDIADLTLYFGASPTFEGSSATTFVQVKYSVSRAEIDFRASAAKKTIQKFAEVYRHYRSDFGAGPVRDRLDFLLVTNQPIYAELESAISGIAAGTELRGQVAEQARQFRESSGLDGRLLREFARKFRLAGRQRSLPVGKRDLAETMIDWSAGSDLEADARLGRLKQMIRDKAGTEGLGRNIIRRPDVLVALGIQDEDQLLPCPSALTKVGRVVERNQLAEAVEVFSLSAEPVLVHGDGGVGKTVFLESLAAAVTDHFETVFFDCFGGGSYRSPEDARHRPEHGLVHIANTMAFSGFCDPILPGRYNQPSLLRAFRKRLDQAVRTVSTAVPGRGIALFIDAADNAIEEAKDRAEQAFPSLLLEMLAKQPVPGVKLVLSARSHRRPPEATGYRSFALHPFTLAETETLLKDRLGNATRSEARVALARSNGNPRVIEYLIEDGDRSVFESSELDSKVALDDLIAGRISQALSDARERGHEEEHIDAFLAGLAVLPPPVPVDEYAEALGIGVSQVESFAADMRPLLERTKHGLMFRDEPTETYVRDRFAGSRAVLSNVADRLFAQQGVSSYAARALPALWQQLGAGERLFELAFDPRLPVGITTTVGQRRVRYSRLRAAALQAARDRQIDNLTELLVELSTVAAVDQRGADYLLENPDLVVAAKDADGLRRLFEARSSWPGSRHARLAIANVLAGEIDEATRHTHAALDWIGHYLRSPREDRLGDGPEAVDIAAIPVYWIAEGREDHAAAQMGNWRDWFSFEVCERVLGLASLAERTSDQPARRLTRFITSLGANVGCLTACLSFADLSRRRRTDLVAALGRVCKRRTKLSLRQYSPGAPQYVLQDGLRKAAAIALSIGRPQDALTISLRASHRRPDLWAFRDTYYHVDEVFPFVFRKALEAAARGTTVHERDLLPSELRKPLSRIPKTLTGDAFRRKARARLSGGRKRAAGSPRASTLSYDDQQAAEGFLASRLDPLLELTRALSEALAATPRTVDRRFGELLDVWEAVRNRKDGPWGQPSDGFLGRLALECASFVLWARSEVKAPTVMRCVGLAESQGVSAERHIRLVSMVAARPHEGELAGRLATRARAQIEEETDVAHRASLLAALGRAMIPASSEEAAAYFQTGLEQLDAIGAGDYSFTSALLSFSASIVGDELEARDFHALTNICELNLADEAEKFPWGDFARGVSRVAGVSGLAKLSRWDDRDRVPLSYSLLPYLTALVETGKMDPAEAVALNQLATPVELYGFGTEALANAVRDAGASPEVIATLGAQFEADHRGAWVPSAADTLVSVLSGTADENLVGGAHLEEARARSKTVTEEHNERRNRRPSARQAWDDTGGDEEPDGLARLGALIAETDPTDASSLEAAVAALDQLSYPYGIPGRLLAELRSRVAFGERTRYVRLLCALPNLRLSAKTDELKACRESWDESSAAIGAAVASEATDLVRLHAQDLLSYGGLSRHELLKLADVTGVSVADLTLEVVQVFAGPRAHVTGAVWLSLASLICPLAGERRGQIALTRLLRADAAKLANSVQDGPWEAGLYPSSEKSQAMAGLIWRCLGSPHAAGRWRAAHCLRSLAQLDRWDVVDAVIGHADEEQAGAFQASELKFYHLHARLWLLMALARLAFDFPDRIATHRGMLLSQLEEGRRPHTLLRHFAAKALVTCLELGSLPVTEEEERRLRAVDASPHPAVEEKLRGNGDFYAGRPKDAPERSRRFGLDYDFGKGSVDNLGRVFGKPFWVVEDLLAEVARELDPDADGMHYTGGRESPFRHGAYGMRAEYHTYGQQLGWHSLLIVAGQLLRAGPVTKDWWYEDDPWGAWLERRLLTRRDGLWLSDGIDRRPPRTIVNLLEDSGEDLAITGDRETLLEQMWVSDPVGPTIAIRGSWKSADDIQVSISSSLVRPESAVELAQALIGEEPYFVWLPDLEAVDDGPGSNHRHLDGFEPWVFVPSEETGLDDQDPRGASVANARPRLGSRFASEVSVAPADPFGRIWSDPGGRVGTRACAWGFDRTGPRHERFDTGTVLLASDWLVSELLTRMRRDLIVLIRLQRYESSRRGEESRLSHSVAVVRIDKELAVEFFEGPINCPHQNKRAQGNQ